MPQMALLSTVVSMCMGAASRGSRMGSSSRRIVGRRWPGVDAAQIGVATGVGFSFVVSVAVGLTAATFESRLGAPSFWSWVLTGLQVASLWAAGKHYWWGWLLGAAVQPPWITYAVLTGQLGFIPGCTISATVQTISFLRNQTQDRISSAHVGTSSIGHLIQPRGCQSSRIGS